MKLKAPLFIGSSLVFSVLVSFILPFTSNATSVYDNAYQTTKDLTIKNKDESSCNPTDIANTWASYITDETKWQQYKQQMPEVKQSFKNALDHGRWGVSIMNANADGSTTQAMAFWTEDTSLSLQWGKENDGRSWVKAPNVYTAVIYCDNNTNGKPAAGLAGQGFSNGHIQKSDYILSWSTRGTRNLLVYTDHPNYPDGYQGDKIVQEWDPPQRMKFYWSVDEHGHVYALYSRNIKTDMLTNCGVTWTLYNSNDKWVRGSTINTKDTIQEMPYGYDTLVPGTYQLELKPKVCIPFIDKGDVQGDYVNIAYNGSFISGVSGDNKNPPTLSVLQTFGLSQAITAPLNIMKSFTSATCSPINIPLFFNQTITLPCMSPFYQNTLPVFFTIWQLSITALITYWFSIKSIGHVKKLINPYDDSIEVVNL